MAYTNVVHIGAGGDLGRPVLAKLVESGKFNITVLARESSSYTSPFPSVTVKKIDLENHNALVSALQGVDAILLTIGRSTDASLKVLVEAAIAAGVKRFIPSDFGTDLTNPRTYTPVFASKRNIDEYLVQRAETGAIEYTNVYNGGFFDWSLLRPDWATFDIPNRQITLYDGGEGKAMWTTLDSISQAIVGILSNPPATKNRAVRIHDFYVSQNEIVAELESITDTKFKLIDDLDCKKAEVDALAALEKGFSLPQVQNYIKAIIFGKESVNSWEVDDDSELLGLQKKDMREEIKKVVQP